MKPLHIKVLHVTEASSTLTPSPSTQASLLLCPTLLFCCCLGSVCMRLASTGVCVGAVVRRTGPGMLPAVLMAPDCLCAGRMEQAPAGRGAVKRITPALTYPCMVYHPVAKYSYCIWRKRTTTIKSGRNRRWSFGRKARSYSPYFERF